MYLKSEIPNTEIGLQLRGKDFMSSKSSTHSARAYVPHTIVPVHVRSKNLQSVFESVASPDSVVQKEREC